MKSVQSRPSRARGLKQAEMFFNGKPILKSRPTRARGLKREKTGAQSGLPAVAPHAGA